MGADLPPYDGIDGDAGVSDKTVHNPLFKDEEHCTVDAPLPPSDGDGGHIGDGGADKPSRSRTLRARVALAIGLVLEVSATLWAFQEAISAGALDGDDVDCGNNGRLFKLYGSYLVMDTCDTQIEADTFFNFTADWVTTFVWEEYVGCDNLTDTLAAIDSFNKLCSCYADKNPIDLTSCSWAALSNPSDGICYAQGVITNSSDETDTERLHAYSFFDGCWATNPIGTSALTIAALVVALSSQFLEAFVGFNYWKDTDKRTAVSSLAAAIFEALGVVVVSSVMLSLPGFYGVSDYTFERLPTLFWLAWATIPIVVVGALAEITIEFSDRVAERLPYLDAVGGGLIWLGAALLEVVVISYLLWTGAGIRDTSEIAREAVGLFVLEMLGLVSMWIAHGLWSRAKFLRASVKRLDTPLRKRVSTGNS